MFISHRSYEFSLQRKRIRETVSLNISWLSQRDTSYLRTLYPSRLIQVVLKLHPRP